MQKILYLLLSLNITYVVAQSDELKFFIKYHYTDDFPSSTPGHRWIRISKTAFARELIRNTNDIERVFNVTKKYKGFFSFSMLPDVSFTVVINGVSYHDVRCNPSLYNRYLQISFALLDCGNDDIVFQNTLIQLPLESIEIVEPPPVDTRTAIQ